MVLDQIWENPGPDGGWSWAILFATFLIRFCSHATQSFSTIMFPTIVASYEVDRETAAWPFTLRLTLRSFTAIVAAWLLKKYSIRKISHSYNFIQVIGYMVCYVGSYNILWLHFGNGIINGIGVGLMDACTIVTLNEYFVTRRVMANGVMYTSTTLSAMVQPPFTMFLLHQYEIRGTFLFYSAWAMQCFIGGFLMRPRDVKHFPVLRDTNDTPLTNNENGSPATEHSKTKGFLCHSWKGVKIRKRSMVRAICHSDLDDSHLEAFNMSHQDVVGNGRTSPSLNGFQTHESVLNGEFHNFETISLESKEDELSRFSNTNLQMNPESSSSDITINKYDVLDNTSSNYASVHQQNGVNNHDTNVLESASANTQQEVKHNIVKEVFEVCCNPVAVIILIVSTLLLPLSQIYALIIMDHAELEGMSEERAVMVVPVLYISELLVRVPMSWIIEKDYIAKRHWYTIIMVILSMGFFAIAFTHDDFVLFTSSAMVGIYTCFMHCLRVVITVDYMGIETLAIMHGLVSFLNGCTYLLVPKILGILFSINNNYKAMFLFLGTTNLLAIFLWQFVDLVHKRQLRNRTVS